MSFWPIGLLLFTVCWAVPLRAIVLWSDLGATLVHETGIGTDILGGAVKRDDSSDDVLYFKFHVDPISDVSTEEYFAAFQLFEGTTERLGVGNAFKAWAYSAFNTAGTGKYNNVFGDQDLRSARPEPASPGVSLPYELPRRGIELTIILKVRYIPGAEDEITVWLNPDLTSGATEETQPDNLTTRFKANASFTEIHLRHGGGGGGWTFSDMAIATSFSDFVHGITAARGAVTDDKKPGISPLTFRSWQREQGWPQHSVRALAQTKDGYLWLGGDDGVTRFDGARFTSFGMREGLRGGRVQALLADTRGGLWIGTADGGVTRWQHGQFSNFTVKNGLPSDSITALAEDDQGQLWIGTDSGLVVWDVEHSPRRPEQVSGLSSNACSITSLFKDSHGSMWVAVARAGIFHAAKGKLEPVTSPSVETLLQDPHSLLVDKAGRVWVGAGDDYVLCRDGDQWRRYRVPRHLERPFVSALAEEPDGTVWAGSLSEGLFRFQAGKLEVFNANSGLSDNFVQSLLVDRERNVWVGTGVGLTRVRRSTLAVLGQAEDLGYGPVQGIAEMAPGIIWAGKPADGLFVWTGRRFTPLSGTEPGVAYPGIFSLLLSHDGTCWAGSSRGLLHFVVPSGNNPSADLAALPDQNVLALAESRSGDVWAGTRAGGLWQGHRGIWTAHTNLCETHPLTSLASGPNETLWIGADGGGLYRYDGNIRAHLDRRSGLLSDSVRALHLDSQSVLWIGTGGGGLGRWEDGRLVMFTTREGLADNTISQILEDDFGRLWLGCNRGIVCVAKKELEQVGAGVSSTVYPQTFTRAEGMPSEECSGGFCPAGLKTKSGLLWFPTLKGIVVADPRPQTAEAGPTSLVLEQVLVDGVAIEQLEAMTRTPANATPAGATRPAGQLVSSPPQIPVLKIPPGKHRVEFHYTGLSFRAPDRLRFRYWLEGLEPNWIEAGPQRTAVYGYVPHGQYRFHVAACTPEGLWGQPGAELALIVRPYFWQTKSFLVATVLSLIALVSGTARVLEKRKLQHRLKRLEQERAVEHERARIAQDLHDDLGSSLARISLLSSLAQADKNNPAQVEAHVGKIAQSADETVRALEEIVWAVRPGSDSLQSLVEYIAHFASELFDGNTTRCRLDLPHDLPTRPLPPEMRHNIFLVVKEALTNAFKHANAKEVWVQAKASNEALELAVQDDGCGFDSRAPREQEKRHGLGNMNRRAEAIGSELSVETIKGQGTRVVLKVPLSEDKVAAELSLTANSDP